MFNLSQDSRVKWQNRALNSTTLPLSYTLNPMFLFLLMVLMTSYFTWEGDLELDDWWTSEASWVLILQLMLVFTLFSHPVSLFELSSKSTFSATTTLRTQTLILKTLSQHFLANTREFPLTVFPWRLAHFLWRHMCRARGHNMTKGRAFAVM